MIVDRYDAVLFDLDGVLYRGERPIAGAADVVAAVRRAGKAVAFVTNNSARTRADVVAHLASVGIEVSEGEVVTSGLVTAATLRARGTSTAFVIGEGGLRAAIEAEAIVVLDDAAGGGGRVADAVVVGWDRRATYDSLRRASAHVQRGAALVATNADATFPAADGTLWPGAGALLAAIVTTTGAEPLVIGKPHAPLLEAALAAAGGGRPLVVGDRMDTDIAGARGLRWDSMLVLTGVSTRDDLRTAGFAPTYLSDDVGLLVEPD